MQRNMVETILGAAVLLIAAAFLFYFSRSVDAGAGSANGYKLTAAFSKIDGVEAGTPVRISGITVGKVASLVLNPENYQAEVTMIINNDVVLPRDTAAVVTSAGLLDGKFMTLEPGSDEETLAAGERIEYTQSTLSLEQLLGQVVFSLTKDKGGDSTDGKKSGGGAPVPPQPPASVSMPDIP